MSRIVLQPSSSARVQQTSLGSVLALERPSTKWQHPWQTALHWQADQARWIATVKPGFVNGGVPVYETTLPTADSRQWDINPLTGRPFFSDYIFANPDAVAGETSVAIPLYYHPALTLNFRALGFDGPGSAVPDYFARLGVGSTPVQTDPEEPVNLAAQAPPKNNRLLRAADLVLHQPRQALTSSISGDPLSGYQQTLGIRAAAAGDLLKVYCAASWSPISNAGTDPLAGDYEEPNYDELLLATVYLLSPPNAAPGSTPDGTWTPYVRHALFWNLSYTTPVLQIVPLDSSFDLTVISTLALGVAGLLINFFAASLEEATNTALNLLSAHTLAGTFWTPTGGGSTSVFPQDVVPPAQGKTGLDKTGRLAAQAAQAAAAIRSATLDPAFPFEGVPFDPSLLTSRLLYT